MRQIHVEVETTCSGCGTTIQKKAATDDQLNDMQRNGIYTQDVCEECLAKSRWNWYDG